MPFAGYKDFSHCVMSVKGQKPKISDPEAYCASIMRQVEKGRKSEHKPMKEKK